MRAAGQFSVPYLVTDAIQAVAFDPAIVDVVTAILDDPDWVMWGANVRDGTPNAAHEWHVDMESVYWPSITVAVGVAGCTPGNATRLIPGSHLVDVTALDAIDASDDAAVVAAAGGRAPKHITGFGDGTFFAFNARSWHCGNVAASNARCVLFMHYHRASDLRVPQMMDYRHQSFHRYAAAFVDGTGGRAQRRVAPGPYASRLAKVAMRLGL